MNELLRALFPGVIADLIFQYARPLTLKENVAEIFDGKVVHMSGKHAAPPTGLTIAKWYPDQTKMCVSGMPGPVEGLTAGVFTTVDELSDILYVGRSERHISLNPEHIVAIRRIIDSEMPD